MAYATADDIETRLGSDDYLALTDRSGAGAADDDAVEDALEDASSLADSYIAASLPLDPVPGSLRRAVIDIAIYYLAGSRETTTQRKRYEDALAWLRDVASGDATLSGGEP